MKPYIIFVSSNVELYGADKSMLALIESMMKKNMNVMLLINKHGRIEEYLKNKNIQYMIIPFKMMINNIGRRRLIKGYVKKIINIFLSFKVKKIMKKMNISPIIVHSNVSLIDFGFYLSKTTSAQHIQHIRELGKEDFGYSFELGIKHFKHICKNSYKVICISNYVYDYYSKLIDNKNMVLVYNGIKANVKFENHLNNNFLFVGRLEESKGQLIALKAFNMLKEYDIHLDIYGDGTYRSVLEKYIKENHLEKVVTLKGYSNSIDYSNYSYGLICSKCEAFGRTTVEYMANSLLVLGSNSGATPELLKNGECGLLFEQDNYVDLANKIDFVLKHQDIVPEIKKKAYNFYLKSFKEETYVANILKIYDELDN